ncbi:MAG TPA: diguanylate cyclase [Usitatibacter sp.]|nr:diguanylate cyclase [Usitatibacter sp.]
MTSIIRRLPLFSMRVRLLVVVLVVAAAAGGAMLAWAVQAQREAAIAQARDFAQSVNQVTLVGLTAMMLTGTSAQRNMFLDQIEHANSVDSLHVVRGAAVVAQYGPGHANERAGDDLERLALATGAPAFQVRQAHGREVLKAVMPAIASHDFLGRNCLGCHNVPAGTVLGAVSLEIDLEHANAVVAQFRRGLLAVALLVFAALAVLTWLALGRWLARPLQSLARNLDDIARGDANLAHRLPASGRDEIADASAAFNRVLEKAAQLLRSERIASDVFEHALEAMLVAGRDGRIIKVNPAFTSTTGFTAEEAIGRNPSMLQSGRQDAAFYRRFWHALNTRGQWQGEIWNRRKNGEIFPAWATISAVRNGHGEVASCVGTFSDITERKRQEALITYQAHHDALTGLPNRSLFQDRVEQALAIARRHDRQDVAIMFLDLDRFKQVNDSFGHDVGDLLLKEVARRLRAAVRESDTVARLGGDEFTVLLPELAGADGAAAVADKILEATREPCRIAGHELFITTSIGIALYPRDGAGVDALMKTADAAMYQVKARGRAGYSLYDGRGAPRGTSSSSVRADPREASRYR